MKKFRTGYASIQELQQAYVGDRITEDIKPSTMSGVKVAEGWYQNKYDPNVIHSESGFYLYSRYRLETSGALMEYPSDGVIGPGGVGFYLYGYRSPLIEMDQRTNKRRTTIDGRNLVRFYGDCLRDATQSAVGEGYYDGQWPDYHLRGTPVLTPEPTISRKELNYMRLNLSEPGSRPSLRQVILEVQTQRLDSVYHAAGVVGLCEQGFATMETSNPGEGKVASPASRLPVINFYRNANDYDVEHRSDESGFKRQGVVYIDIIPRPKSEESVMSE